MTNIIPIFVSMNIFLKFLRIVLLSIIIVPIWFSLSLVEFLVTLILYIFFSKQNNIELKCRNNINQIIKEFKNHLMSIFIYF